MCHIGHEQPIKIESQKLDLSTLNRVSYTRNASKKYSLKTKTTNYIVGILWPVGHFGPIPLHQTQLWFFTFSINKQTQNGTCNVVSAN